MVYFKYALLAIAILVLAGVAAFFGIRQASYNPDAVATNGYPSLGKGHSSTQPAPIKTAPPSSKITQKQPQVDAVRKTKKLEQGEQLEGMEAEVQARIDFYFDAFTQEEQDQLNRIKSTYGYFEDTHGQALLTYQTYLEYDDATLESLAQHDDLMAIQILGDRAFDKANYSAAMQHYTKAASLGSLQDIENIKSLNYELLIKALSEKNLEKVQELKLKVYAWLGVYGKRGGWDENKKIEDFKSNPMFDTSITSDEQIAIEKYTHTFYEMLESERRKRGLGPFDNQIPELLIEYNELMSGPLP